MLNLRKLQVMVLSGPQVVIIPHADEPEINVVVRVLDGDKFGPIVTSAIIRPAVSEVPKIGQEIRVTEFRHYYGTVREGVDMARLLYEG